MLNGQNANMLKLLCYVLAEMQNISKASKKS